MYLDRLFKLMADKQASDLYISCGAPINIKVNGVVHPVSSQSMDVETVRRIAYDLMTKEQAREFENEREMNLSHLDRAVGNFRINIFRQRGSIALVIRYVRSDVPPFEALHLPPVLLDLIMEKRGMVLVAGATGSGKSTTLAAMIDHRNTNTTGHILTVEDPIEYLFTHRQSIVNQREIGVDTHNYHMALQNALREAPDLIMIGEIRDKETMQAALLHTLTGHLCLSTIHANNSYHALSRIINLFPHDARSAVLSDLSIGLRAIVSQRLVRNVEGAQQPAVEILLNTSLIAELIKNGEFTQIKEAMEQSLYPGSQTFEQALCKLFLDERITYDEAMIALRFGDQPRVAHQPEFAIVADRHGRGGAQDTERAPERRLREHDDQSGNARTLELAVPRSMDSAATATLDLACELIERRSLTPDDAGCQQRIAARLAPLGFRCETLVVNGVTNLWARLGDTPPLVCLAGHTDVVPTGPLDRVGKRPVHAHAARRLSVRARRGRHEGIARRVRRRGRTTRCARVSSRLDRAADHVGRGRSVDRRHGEGRRTAARAKATRIDYCIVGEPSSSRASAT